MGYAGPLFQLARSFMRVPIVLSIALFLTAAPTLPAANPAASSAAGTGKVYHRPKPNNPISWDAYEDANGDDPGEKAAIQARNGGGDGTPKPYTLDTDGSKTRDSLNARNIAARLAEHAKS